MFSKIVETVNLINIYNLFLIYFQALKNNLGVICNKINTFTAKCECPIEWTGETCELPSSFDICLLKNCKNGKFKYLILNYYNINSFDFYYQRRYM